MNTIKINVFLCYVLQFSFSEQLRLLAAVENQNLTETARHARLEFENIPAYVEMMTRTTRQGKEARLIG